MVSRPSPTTISPGTAPPWNEIPNAFRKPEPAAWATRTLARTETFIPMKPAEPLATAPSRKPPAYHRFSPKPSRSRTGTPTRATVRYWRFMNALAPSRMASAIEFALSCGAGAASTRRYRRPPVAMAITELAKAITVTDI